MLCIFCSTKLFFICALKKIPSMRTRVSYWGEQKKEATIAENILLLLYFDFCKHVLSPERLNVD